MKKFLVILVTICLLAGAFCVTAFAASDVLTVSAIVKGKADPVVIGSYTNFEDGWNAAMEIAGDEDEMDDNGYERIVVDLLTDWNSDDYGRFSDDFINGAGFSSDTILIPEGAKVTLNMNNYTIDRDLNWLRSDGEVIRIDDDADVIINNGTIKGGYGDMGDAGAIEIADGARVTLNNVNIVDNLTTYDGGGIFVGSDSFLTVNGGSFKNNGAIIGGRFWNSCGGAVCVEGGTAFFNGVEFTENIAPSDEGYGAAVYVEDGGKVVIENCTFNRNGIQTADRLAAETVIHGEDSSITITNSTFTDNVGKDLFYMEDSILNITGGAITKTAGANIFYLEDTQADIDDVTITDNASGVMTLENGDELVNMIDCILGNNTPTQTEAAFVIVEPNTLTMLDCTLGNTTFSNRQYVKITSSEVTREEAVIGVELLRTDGTVDSVRYYKDFASGWGYATECMKTNFFDRVAVSLYADWNTHEFGAVSIPENARMTLNMNGHKIDRAMTTWQYNGEVICIGANADVIINGGKSGDAIVNAKDAKPAGVEMGTITGGWSSNGAGGIHIFDNAKVQLNNVCVDDNIADDDNGAGIAIYDGAYLVMNGGSLNNNILDGSAFFTWDISVCARGGGLYVNDATAVLNGVEIKNNLSKTSGLYGVAVFSDDGDVTLNACVINGNGLPDYGKDIYEPQSVIDAYGGKMTIKDCEITNNSNCYIPLVVDGFNINKGILSRLINMDDATVYIDNTLIEDNKATVLLYAPDVMLAKVNLTVINTKIINNQSTTLDLDDMAEGSYFEGCEFNNNIAAQDLGDYDIYLGSTVIFRDCDMGDSTYDNEGKKFAIFQDANGKVVGSIFGEGSLAMIVAFTALITSVVAIVVNVSSKKKAVPATVADADEE